MSVHSPFHGDPGRSTRGIDRLSVSTAVAPEWIASVLGDLASCSAAHTWSRYASPVDPEELLAKERELRPTTFFAYFAETSKAERELVAVATVADRLNHDFPYDGWPVLARCVIRPAFQGQSLYRRILEHRIRYCEARWGDGLRAIHLGTGDERVRNVARRAGFVQVGEEELACGKRVSALFRFSPTLSAELGEAVERRKARASSGTSRHPAARSVRQMQALVTEMLASGFAPPKHRALKLELEAVERATGWAPSRHPAIAALLEAFQAIPLAHDVPKG
ncbi:MAG TPA: hypothetical protein VM925_00965 [Labilithrix sp.]|jgi:GNAT superfamily N-acetyltransferase|nr:hypothetical protein [Labilithrix sp.]